MIKKAIALTQILDLIPTLSVQDRVTLMEQLVISFKNDLPVSASQVQSVSSDWEHQPWTDDELRVLMMPNLKTGAEIAAMLEMMEPIELIDPEITDPVDWLKAQRRKQDKRLEPFWNGDQ